MWGIFNRRKKPKYNAFISYSREHKELVKGLFKMLSRLDDGVFLDDRNIDVGADWRDAIREAIANCNDFYLVWCEHAAKSEVIADEIDWALQRKGDITIIIVCIGREPLPVELKDINAITELKGYCPENVIVMRDEPLSELQARHRENRLRVDGVITERYRAVTGRGPLSGMPRWLILAALVTLVAGSYFAIGQYWPEFPFMPVTFDYP